MVEDELRYLLKRTKNSQHDQSYILLTCFDVAGVERPSLEKREPELRGCRRVAVRGAQDDLDGQVADALPGLGTSMVRRAVHHNHDFVSPYCTILLRQYLS